MNAFLALSLLVTSVSGQFFGNQAFGDAGAGFGSGFQGVDASNSFLDAAQNNNLFSNFGLNAANRNRAGLQAVDQLAANEQVAKSEAVGEQVVAGTNLKHEDFVNKQDFDNVDFVNNQAGASKTGLSFLQESGFDKKEALSANQASKVDGGNRLFFDDKLAAQQQAAADSKAAAQVEKFNGIKAQDASENQLSAAEQLQKQQQERLQAQQQFQQGFLANDQFFGNSGLDIDNGLGFNFLGLGGIGRR